LCGILAETVETEIGLAAIVGIGINLHDENFPAELEPFATSLRSVTGGEVNRDILINELLKALGERYEMLDNDSGANTPSASGAQTLRMHLAEWFACRLATNSLSESRVDLKATGAAHRDR